MSIARIESWVGAYPKSKGVLKFAGVLERPIEDLLDKTITIGYLQDVLKSFHQGDE